MKPYFFTSWAAGEDRPWVRRFHLDLERELRVREGPSAGGRLGDASLGAERAVAEAATVPAMVALLSERYFHDSVGGRQWAVFRERIRRHSAGWTEEARECLVPVIWRPLRPGLSGDDIVSIAGFRSRALSGTNTAQSVFELMRTHALGDYRSVLGRVAEAVIGAERISLAPLDAVAARETGPAFPAPHRAGGPSPLDDRDPWPRTVAISFVGADRPWAERLSERLRAEGYRPVPVQWRPGRAEPLTAAVARAREAGEQVVVLLSGHFLAPHLRALTRWSDGDWQTALGDSEAGRGRLIRVRIDGAALPEELRPLPALSVDGPDENALGELMNVLGNLTGAARYR